MRFSKLRLQVAGRLAFPLSLAALFSTPRVYQAASRSSREFFNLLLYYLAAREPSASGSAAVRLVLSLGLR